jgi:hypothetical protein
VKGEDAAVAALAEKRPALLADLRGRRDPAGGLSVKFAERHRVIVCFAVLPVVYFLSLPLKERLNTFIISGSPTVFNRKTPASPPAKEKSREMDIYI